MPPYLDEDVFVHSRHYGYKLHRVDDCGNFFAVNHAYGTYDGIGVYDACDYFIENAAIEDGEIFGVSWHDGFRVFKAEVKSQAVTYKF